jgi:hypothetical protein
MERHLFNSDEGTKSNESVTTLNQTLDVNLYGLIPEMLKAASYNIDQETMLNENVDSVFQQAPKNESEDYDLEHTSLRFNFSLYKPQIMHTYRRHKVLEFFRSDCDLANPGKSGQKGRLPNLYLEQIPGINLRKNCHSILKDNKQTSRFTVTACPHT